VLAYVITQVVAATVAALVLFGVARSHDGFSAKDSGFASNGYTEHSPAGYGLSGVILVEIVLTAIFLYVIIGSTDVRAPAGFAGVAIGFTLVIIHLVSIPVSNTSVNPARSTGPAIIQHGWALGQLWVFWLAPIVGAAAAGLSYRFVLGERMASPGEPLAAAKPKPGPGS
jgi:aquaporin Z